MRRAAIRTAPVFLAAVLAACGNSDGFDLSAPRAEGVDRTIDLSGATGPLPLDTPEDAARAAIGARLFYSSVIDTIAAKRAGVAKATTESCADGGTRTTEESSTRKTVWYESCLEGYRFTDGYLSAGVDSVRYPWSDASAQIGENDTPLVGENRDPANDTRSLQLGTLVGGVKIDFGGDVEEVDARVNLAGAQSDLDGTPRMDYGMDDVHVNVQFDGDFLLIDESGPFRLAGDCGVGRASVSTPGRLRVHKDTGSVTAGQLALANDAGRTATATFNADESVDVAAGGSTAHYTLEEFRALCAF